jgi:hypothetical protein
MAFSAFSIASSRVLPNPDISIPETFAHFKGTALCPATGIRSHKLHRDAFVCLRESGCDVHQPPRLAGVVNTDSGGDLFS